MDGVDFLICAQRKVIASVADSALAGVEQFFVIQNAVATSIVKTLKRV